MSSAAFFDQALVASCPVCSRNFRPRTLASAWDSVNQHLEERRRQGCLPHAAVHSALHRHGGHGFGCAGCPLRFSSAVDALHHVHSTSDDAHAHLHTPDTRFAPPSVVAASVAASQRRSRRLTNRMNTELYSQANQGNVDGVRRLLELNTDPNITAGTDSITPLMTAAEAGHAEIVRMLLATRGCDVNRENVYGQTALGFAAQNGRFDCVKHLALDPNINLSAEAAGHTAAQLARRAGHDDIADVLAAATRDTQLADIMMALASGVASGNFDSGYERVAALAAHVNGEHPGGRFEHGEMDEEPEGFNAVPLCTVCMGENVDTVTLPCFHASCCSECAMSVWQNDGVCAVCRQPITQLERIYF